MEFSTFFGAVCPSKGVSAKTFSPNILWDNALVPTLCRMGLGKTQRSQDLGRGAPSKEKNARGMKPHGRTGEGQKFASCDTSCSPRVCAQGLPPAPPVFNVVCKVCN
jgi:hypothetical protein